MEYRTLGRSDLRVSAVGLGAATFAREIDETIAWSVLDHAVEQGITFFDTAEAYSSGRSEEVLGRWIAGRGLRDKIVLATKVAPPLHPTRVIASAEESLRRLQVDTIDLFQLHSWDPDVALEETLAALDTLVRGGKVRYVGCSNFMASQLGEALQHQQIHGWARFEAVQPVYNLAMRAIEEDLLPLTAGEQIGVITYSPLGAGFLTGKYQRGGAVPQGTRFDIVPGHQDIYFNDNAFQAMERLRSTAELLGVPMARLALAWVLGQPGITTTLIGARSPNHVDQALEAAALQLTPALRAQVEA